MRSEIFANTYYTRDFVVVWGEIRAWSAWVFFPFNIKYGVVLIGILSVFVGCVLANSQQNILITL